MFCGQKETAAKAKRIKEDEEKSEEKTKVEKTQAEDALTSLALAPSSPFSYHPM